MIILRFAARGEWQRGTAESSGVGKRVYHIDANHNDFNITHFQEEYETRGVSVSWGGRPASEN